MWRSAANSGLNSNRTAVDATESRIKGSNPHVK